MSQMHNVMKVSMESIWQYEMLLEDELRWLKAQTPRDDTKINIKAAECNAVLECRRRLGVIENIMTNA
jgi:hypothetical protein